MKTQYIPSLQYQKGFTLIELMVVVSIISLLSSVLLSSLNTARDKADNAYRLGMIEEYKKALLLYADDHNGYTLADEDVDTNFCLSLNSCEGLSPSTFINNALAPYIKVPASGFSPFNCTVNGVSYTCDQEPDYECSSTAGNPQVCKDLFIFYTLHGKNKNCGSGLKYYAAAATPSDTATSCALRISNKGVVNENTSGWGSY